MDSAKRAKVEAAGFKVADDASEFLNLSPAERRAVELLAEPEFVAFCEVWKNDADRHCPAPLIDWLLERGYELEADAARWAVGAKKRYCPVIGKHPIGKHDYKSHATPIGHIEIDEGNDVWVVKKIGPLDAVWFKFHVACYANHFPVTSDRRLPSFNHAIAFYLTHFDRELAAKYPHG